MTKGITLITPAHANPIALKRTMDSVKHICNEFLVADLCMFKEDSQKIEEYKRIYNLQIIYKRFNHLYKNGFSNVLNSLAYHATNDVVLYLNVGEVLHKTEVDILSCIEDEYNSWYIDHPTEKHRWWRCYNRQELEWSGRIHEELVGEFRPFHKPLLTFADTEKDMDNPFKAWVANDVKEMVYWQQLMKIIDFPEELGATSLGWVEFAKSQYDSMKKRMIAKGNRVTAFDKWNKEMYFNDLRNNPNLIDFPFQSTEFIEFQGDPKFLGK